MRVWVFLQKEFLLLSRDLHALLLLFLMPTLFILIMSLAMQNTFSNHTSVQINYFADNQDQGESGANVIADLSELAFFKQLDSQAPLDELQARTGSDEVQFLLHIPAEFSVSLGDTTVNAPIQIYTAPGTQASVTLLFEARVRELLGRLMVASLGAPSDAMDKLGTMVTSQPALKSDKAKLPTSVQQNVPAWLVFSMFFIAIPISTTLLGEKSQGTLDRLATMGVSRVQFLLSKLLTYMLINLIQVVLMFMVGIWIVPLLGGDALTLGDSPVALILIALATSCAAVSFALLIANIAQTTEQATIFAGVSNILLAAIGGVMVPRFVMPPAMQNFSQFSPHSWGLEGFLDIILRRGSVVDILPEVFLLLMFSCIMMLGATRLLMRR